MSPPSDPRWPAATSLVRAAPRDGRSCVALLGVPTFENAVSPRSKASTPLAVRLALERFSTYSWLDEIDLADHLDVVDYGDVIEPDGPKGLARVAASITGISPSCGMLVVLGGDNAATFASMSAVAGSGLDAWGLVTFDAHLDLRDGWSNGSPVRQLLEAGLPGEHVVQVGLADFSNSSPYAQRARDVGIHVVPRVALRRRPIDEVVAAALSAAGGGARPVYVDIDLDVCDEAVVPGCPAAAPGGLSADELRCAVRLLAADPTVQAIDFTEVDVERDAPDGRTVRLVALLVLEALAGYARRAA